MQPRPAIADLTPYEPGKPAAEVRRETGLHRVVKLASNEGAYGPFPAALEAIERQVRGLNRYPEQSFELISGWPRNAGWRRRRWRWGTAQMP